MPRITLTVLERAELTRRASVRGDSVSARRARVILLLARGMSWAEVMERLGCSRGFVARWARRFQLSRMAGLSPLHRGRDNRMPRSLERRIVLAASHRLADGRPRWSTRSLAERLGVSHMTVHRIWQKGVEADRRGGGRTR